MTATRPERGQQWDQVVRAVRGLAARLADLRSHALGPHGIDDSQLEVLEVLGAATPDHRLTAGELSQRCRVTRGAISQRLATMEAAGLVERAREEPDRRTVHVSLTRAGARKLDAVADDVAAADARLLDGMIANDRETLTSILASWQPARTPSTAPAEPTG